ncbi:MAG: AbrB family transcriptional regulator [Bacillota bacterium]|nr:AbrB family transcriptional regulator [Bacillota bacterium]
MALKIVWETILLFMLGSVGWALFSKLRIPVAPFLGSLAVLTILRTLGVDVPLSPAWLFPFMQVLIGIRIGAMVNRNNIRALRTMIIPAIIIVLWAQSIIFIMGTVMTNLTSLDLPTALLSFSMAGVVEMTIIGMDVDADLGFIIMMQMARLLITFILFPIIIRKLIGKQNDETGRIGELLHGHPPAGSEENTLPEKKPPAGFKQMIYSSIAPFWYLFQPGKQQHNNPSEKINRWMRINYRPAGRIILIFLVAIGGGAIFYQLGVPAGMMVGSMFAVALITMMGVEPLLIPPRIFNLLLVGMGIVVADNMLPEQLTKLSDPRMLMLVAIAITVIFATSFMVALLIRRFSGRDFPTCLLASSPAGLFVMTILAIRYDKDPFFVSMLLLCKVLSIQIIVPFVFLYFV